MKVCQVDVHVLQLFPWCRHFSHFSIAAIFLQQLWRYCAIPVCLNITQLCNTPNKDLCKLSCNKVMICACGIQDTVKMYFVYMCTYTINND